MSSRGPPPLDAVFRSPSASSESAQTDEDGKQQRAVAMQQAGYELDASVASISIKSTAMEMEA